jgi:hypothetical protein
MADRTIKDSYDPVVKGPNRFDPRTVAEIHSTDDVDTSKDAHHHTLGPSSNQSSRGNHNHDGTDSVFLMEGVTISGSRGGNVALANLISELAQVLGFTNNTTV